jgi:lipopolysaccharide/colanic/teichoic acid biosynthesis glycosyltransferase
MNSEITDLSTEIYLPPSSDSVLASPSYTPHGNSPWLAPADKPLEVKIFNRDKIYSSKLSPWCASIWKRAFDLVCVIPALVLISPALGIIAIAVRLTSPGPVIFRQRRAGQNRKLFTIYKFRTMVEKAETIGPGHTATLDPRITPIGRFLRRFKLDELPQLYNVLRGNMSLVGPRPKLPNHERISMACRPGVTGAATLAFRYEARILCKVATSLLETFYQEHVIPLKTELDNDYMQRATFISDVLLLLATVLRLGKHLTHEDLVQSKPMGATSGRAIFRKSLDRAG